MPAEKGRREWEEFCENSLSEGRGAVPVRVLSLLVKAQMTGSIFPHHRTGSRVGFFVRSAFVDY